MSETPPNSEPLPPLPPGGASRDYARDSMAPFQPLVTAPPADQTQGPSRSKGVPLLALAGLTGFTAVVVVGVGFLLLG